MCRAQRYKRVSVLGHETFTGRRGQRPHHSLCSSTSQKTCRWRWLRSSSSSHHEKNTRTSSHDPRCMLSGALGKTMTVRTPVLGLSPSCFGRCFLKCFSVLPYSHFPSTRSWFSLWCSRLFLPWPSCLTLGLVLSQLALDNVLAISVVFFEISVVDAVAAASSGGQHVMRSRRMRLPWCRFGADSSVFQLVRDVPVRRHRSLL